MTILKNGNHMPLSEFEKFKEYTGIDFHQLIVLTVAGSHMYGMNTMNSDSDFLGIYMPTKEQLLLNEYPKQASYPKSSGLDLQIWSVHYFMKLAMAGETMAIDLLHAPDNLLVACEPDIWSYLQRNRWRFFTKNMKAFVSYARKQAAKYGLKGDRIETLDKVIKYFDDGRGNFKSLYLNPDLKLSELWKTLPTGKHIHFLDTKPYRMYQVCGKKFQETVKISYIKEHLQKSLTEYGYRAKLAKDNKGVDWKAVSHALRSSYQVWEILIDGDYEYPLRDANFLKDVKLGKLDFTTVVQPCLEKNMDAIENLIEKSDLPDKVDREFWNGWLIYLMMEHVL